MRGTFNLSRSSENGQVTQACPIRISHHLAPSDVMKKAEHVTQIGETN